MPSTAAQIIAAALGTSLANDQGQTLLAQDTTEALNVLNRVLAQVYTLAALPDGGAGYDANHGAFVRTGSITMGSPATVVVSFPADCVRILALSDVGGTYVAQSNRLDQRLGIVETPPAVIVENRTVASVGRTGDPTASSVLTCDYCYKPATLTSSAHFIGAVTPTDASTSSWPDSGDAFLVSTLALYWCRKDGTRDPAEMESLQSDMTTAAGILGGILDVSGGRLAAVQVDA